MRATYGLLVAISLLLLSAVPSAFALESPEPVTPQRDSAGKIRIRLICGNRATDARMALLVKYPEVQVVTASGDDELTDAGLAHLKSLPKLESLGLGGSKITADGLAHLCGNSSLRSLTLWEMPLSEKAAEQIAAIPN